LEKKPPPPSFPTSGANQYNYRVNKNRQGVKIFKPRNKGFKKTTTPVSTDKQQIKTEQG
jgi:hypothetical protein